MIVSDNKKLAQVLDEYISARLFSSHVMLPGKVISYNPENQSANLLVLTKYISEITGAFDNTDDLIISKVPVVFDGSADNCGMTYPVKAGTLGKLEFADWSLAEWAFSDGKNPSDIGVSSRSHEFRDATFTPGLRPFSRKMTFFDSDNIVIHNSDDKDFIKMSLKPNGKIAVENSTNELLAVIKELITVLESGTVVTALGASPFTAATLNLLGITKAKLETFI